MNITELPFNRLIDIKLSSDADYLLSLDSKIDYTNHLGTVHASALFSLAEATSGHFLLDNFLEYDTALVPVVRKVDVKYKKPAIGKIYSTARSVDITIGEIKGQLISKKRVSFKLKVDLFDVNKINVVTGNFEWFVTISDTGV